MTGGSSQSGQHIRRDPRAVALGLDARYRAQAGGDWRGARLIDLSLGGALLSCGQDEAVVVGFKITLLLERKSDGQQIEVPAEVLRVIERSNSPRRAAVRFISLDKSSSHALAAVLNERLALEVQEEEESTADAGPLINGRPINTLRLHDTSLYELLALEPVCESGVLESAGEVFIEIVGRELVRAVGRREQRLQVLHNSLVRLRPLWNDPIKRVRYDLRWGYVRAEERLRDAESGAGVHAHVLSGVWFDLYPDMVREAEKVMLRARADGIVACLKQAIELDPFNRRRRQRLALIESPPEPDEEGAEMPAPGEVQTVRGSLADLPLRVLMRAVAEDEEDCEIVVRLEGKAVGVVGITRGDLVTAIAGEARGVAAVRTLIDIDDGSFVAKYTQPRAQLRHMKRRALEVLEQALNERV